MFKNNLFFSFFILIFLVTWKQDLNAKTSRNAKEVQVDSISIFAWELPVNPKTWKNCKVPADSIIAAIERNENLLIDSCEVFGRLRYEGDTINVSIEVLRSVLHDSVFFGDCCFMKKVRFVEDSLMRDINFYEVIFNQDVNFSGSIFRESASFNSSTFRKTALFSDATFDTSIMFSQSKFLESAWFQHTIFGGNAYFIHTDFGGWVDFLGATFKREVTMLSVKFTNIFISWGQLKGHLSSFPNVYSQFIKKFEENR
ncbi:MAG: pentapeptide repeat-containing protein, partial [bacterium]